MTPITCLWRLIRWSTADQFFGPRVGTRSDGTAQTVCGLPSVILFLSLALVKEPRCQLLLRVGIAFTGVAVPAALLALAAHARLRRSNLLLNVR